ncbi:MAG: hypothetical protein ACTSU5_12695 [Promethearchaeota archaeon]
MSTDPPEMRQTRGALVKKRAPFNQMRNVIYHLVRYLRSKGVEDVRASLRAMGRNTARTFVNSWTPSASATVDRVKEIYQFVLGSRVVASVGDGGTVRVVDKKCRFCKYRYDDIDVAGCEIVVGLVAEMLGLEPVAVEESKTLGGGACVHAYKLRGREANEPRRGGGSGGGNWKGGGG